MADSTSSAVQIIPYYAHPHVYTVINDYTWYDETVASASDTDDLPFATAVVTGADSGIDNTFVRVNSLKTKQAIFGKGNYQKYGQASIQADVLFNGQTNVWFCRVLPDNATYANVVFLAHYRKGKILDELGQETGKYRLEIKFSTAYATKPYITDGATSDDDIDAFARSLTTTTADPLTGYMTVPICAVRSIGRGKYGNMYSMSIARDADAEKEYDLKMYKFSLISNKTITQITNVFSGSLYQTTRYEMSTLISDVLDQFSTGSCPVSITPYEDSFQTLYDFYKDIVDENYTYIHGSGGDATDVSELEIAQAITEDTFDPLFGYTLNTKTGEQIPYYRNYSTKSTGAWVAPDLEIPNTTGASKPLNTSDWSTAYVGARVLVAADPLNDGLRWIYKVLSIDSDTGNIVYDEGEETAIDADQYDGVILNQSVGQRFTGGHDGDFQEITVNGVTRAPSDAEMKLLLSREYVKAFRGEKDRKILSPFRVNLDFLFDANYNMTSDEGLILDSTTSQLYANSTVLTDKDAQALAIIGTSDFVMDFSDLNVKAAMYDLNEFRNKNGMSVNPERGAGCSLYLDCNFTGLKSVSVNYELLDIIDMMEEFDGRATSIDLGFYEIFDPVTGKRIKVTTSYFIAKNLVPHLMREGLNKPFTFNYATLRALQRDNALSVSGEFIRDSFRPDIDIIDWDVKEKLYTSRINYYITSDEGRVVQRACQNTRQTEASALLEENNVRVLNTLKKGLEKACRGYLYNWNEPEVRKGYTDAQMEVYRPWIGTMVQDLSIEFTANEWEQERMIMHCYVVVKFRDIIKRIILEINIQRPDYSGGDE
jgi:hypothetical protein